jgi:hypothetical protein
LSFKRDAKSNEVRQEKARFIPINDKTLPQLHTYQHYRSEFILEMTRFDFASVSFCRFLYVLKNAANNPPKKSNTETLSINADSVVPLQKQPQGYMYSSHFIKAANKFFLKY